MAQKEDLMIFQGGEDLTICHILDALGEVMGKSNYGTLDKSLRAKRSNKIEWIRGRLAFKDNIRAGREVGDQVNGSRQWVPQWAAVSNPSDIAGVCGNGVCNLDKSKTKASHTCLPGTSKVGKDGQCYDNSSLIGNCNGKHENLTSKFRISADTSSTLFVKVRANGSWTLEGHAGGSNSSSDGMGSAKEKVVIIPTVLSMVVLIVLLCLLLYFSVHIKRTLKREMESSFILSGAPMSFTYRNLQIRTCNFTQLLGTGEFGSVYKGSLGDGTLVAVKKLDRVLPHGEKEFITEVNTIGSMHHMNLVHLCGYCSEGSHRLEKMNSLPLMIRENLEKYYN
ncbi:hypothetical protein JHK87_040304 [Glycine soja]|nr:hypothetical protein JHK87_040304 [Glycine soja]